MKVVTLLLGVLAFSGMSSTLLAQQNSYKQTNLVANLPGVASHTDAQLSNSWGMAFFSGNPFWIADNNSGVATLYDAQGNKQQLVVGIPSASVNPCNPGCPTGIVANGTTDFGGGAFLFVTEDGIFASWNGSGNATKVVDNSAAGAVYKGLAMITNGSGNFLLAANFRSGKIDVLDRTFKMASLSGTFTDANLPAGFAPHGVHVVGSMVFVAYAMQDAAKHDPVNQPGSGFVDVFDMNGNFVKRLASNGPLNSPWGVVQAPATFGAFANDILVGNFGDGTINAFDPNTGKSLSQVMDSGNNVIVNPGLWDLKFGQGGTGDPNTLYFTAGGADQTHGLFATLVPTMAATGGPDFSLSLSQQNLSIARGNSTSLMVNASASGGFNSPITLSCTAPAGVTCSFSPMSITPGSSVAMSRLTIAVASTFSSMNLMMWMPFSIGLLGLVPTRNKLFAGHSRRGLLMIGLLVVGAALLLTVACGGVAKSSSRSPGNANVMVVGTSGQLAHAVPVMVTVQ